MSHAAERVLGMRSATRGAYSCRMGGAGCLQ